MLIEQIDDTNIRKKFNRMEGDETELNSQIIHGRDSINKIFRHQNGVSMLVFARNNRLSKRGLRESEEWKRAKVAYIDLIERGGGASRRFSCVAEMFSHLNVFGMREFAQTYSLTIDDVKASFVWSEADYVFRTWKQNVALREQRTSSPPTEPVQQNALPSSENSGEIAELLQSPAPRARGLLELPPPPPVARRTRNQVDANPYLSDNRHPPLLPTTRRRLDFDDDDDSRPGMLESFVGSAIAIFDAAIAADADDDDDDDDSDGDLSPDELSAFLRRATAILSFDYNGNTALGIPEAIRSRILHPSLIPIEPKKKKIIVDGKCRVSVWEDNRECYLCMDNRACVKSNQCGHIVSCTDCFNKLCKDECPFCKTSITSVEVD